MASVIVVTEGGHDRVRSVKVRRGGISAEQAAEAIRYGLGSGYQVQTEGDAVLRVRKGLARAKVSLRGEPGGTVFDIRGEGIGLLLFHIPTKMLNDRGIARADGDGDRPGRGVP